MQVSQHRFPVSNRAGSVTVALARFGGFSEPLGLRPGQEAWVVWPEGGKASLALRVYAGNSGGEPLFVAENGQQRRVSPQLVRRKSATYGLAVGSAVLIPYASTSRYGRVAAVNDDRLMVEIAGSQALADLSLYDVIPLDGSAHYGAPVVFRSEGDWCWGQLLSCAGPSSWILDWRGATRELQNPSLRPIACGRFGVGERVLALLDGTMRPATVSATLAGEVGYALRFDGARREELRSYSQVSAPMG